MAKVAVKAMVPAAFPDAWQGRLARRLLVGHRAWFAVAFPAVVAEAAHQIAGRRQICGMGKPHQNHVGGGVRPGRGFHLLMAFEQHLPGTGEHGHGEAFGEIGGACPLGLARSHVRGTGGLDQGHGVNRVGEIGDHLRRLCPVIGQPAELLERLACVAGKHGLQQIEDAAPIGKPEQPEDSFRLDLARAEGDGAVEDRQRIAHRAFGGARDQQQSRGVGRGIFLCHDAGEMLGKLLDLDALQVEALAARQHGDRNLPRLGGGEDELHMLRGLFQSS